mgnify:CR=1 FL=1
MIFVQCQSCLFEFYSCVCCVCVCVCVCVVFLFQAEDGIRDLVRSRGLGDVYKRQELLVAVGLVKGHEAVALHRGGVLLACLELIDQADQVGAGILPCLLYTSDAADERSSVDLGGRRIIKKKKT